MKKNELTNGFDDIDWTATGVQPGDVLYVCGTHTEAFTIGGSGTSDEFILIRGDYPGDAGTIDSQDTRASGILINNKDYAGASKEMLDSKWAKQTPDRAVRLSSLMLSISK